MAGVPGMVPVHVVTGCGCVGFFASVAEQSDLMSWKWLVEHSSHDKHTSKRIWWLFITSVAEFMDYTRPNCVMWGVIIKG